MSVLMGCIALVDCEKLFSHEPMKLYVSLCFPFFFVLICIYKYNTQQCFASLTNL